jgi:hypothetical protein
MSEVTPEIQRQFEQQVVEACDRIFTEGVRQMRSDIEKAGLVLTGELKESLYSERTYVTDRLEASFRMGMRGQGRFKDMRQISYAKFPSVEMLKEFIEELGVDKFINNDTVSVNGKNVQLYVPGYYIGRKQKKQITAERATTRIAYGMGRALMDRNTIKRRGNSFYNVNKGEIYGDISAYLMKKLPTVMMQAMKEYYEKPFYDRE